MNFPYLQRLMCLCSASFFLVNGAVGLGALLFSRVAVRYAETRRASTAARFLFALRMAPYAFGLLIVWGLCVPSYFELEPVASAERIGLLCSALGLLGGTTWMISIARAARALAASRRYNRHCQLTARETDAQKGSSRVLMVEDEAPLLAMAGLVRPRLLISRGVMRALSPEELDTALRHETAHRVSRDNFKRLVILLAPDIFPFVRCLRPLEHSWMRFAEWAADDDAVGGDLRRALWLAGALLHVARMGVRPRLSFLHISLVAGGEELAERVERLLHMEPSGPRRASRPRPLIAGAGLLVASFVAVFLASPATLSSVHQVLERFLR
jgi:beta-lactamase regulating signal transducer with metallopeptidase domain